MSGSLSHNAYLQLRESIERFELLPGTPLQEVELASKLGTSRTPIREALRRLAAEGLVELIHGRGAAVARGSIQEIRDAYQVREQLEPYAAALAARRAPHAPGFAELIERFEELVSPPRTEDDIRAREELDRRFHTAVVAATENKLLVDIVLDMRSRMQRMFVHLGSGGRFEQVRLEHLSILVAIRSGDEDLAARLMREHLHHTVGSLLPSNTAQTPLVNSIRR